MTLILPDFPRSMRSTSLVVIRGGLQGLPAVLACYKYSTPALHITYTGTDDGT